jgi:hypothetical protein
MVAGETGCEAPGLENPINERKQASDFKLRNGLTNNCYFAPVIRGGRGTKCKEKNL